MAIPLSDNPERVCKAFVNGREYVVENVWRHGDRVVFKFEGVDSISAAEVWRTTKRSATGANHSDADRAFRRSGRDAIASANFIKVPGLRRRE